MAWLTGYGYRKKKPVNATAAGVQTLYQVKLLVGESSGAVGEEIDCESHCQDFPNDIRFTDTDEVTKHDYWVETITGITPNRLATIWIEVATIPVAGSIDLYMYYGKTSDSGESNGSDAFSFFDGFLPQSFKYGEIADDGVWYSYTVAGPGDPGWYGSAAATFFTSCRPFAIYDTIANKTFIAYGGYASPSPWKERITYFDHATNTVATPITVANNPSGVDAHANPAIAIDSNGYLYMFYGTNGNYSTKMSRSSNPRDISTWDSEVTIFTSRGAYPQPFFIGNTLYLFFRYDEGASPGGFPRAIEYMTSTDWGSTWSARTKIIQQSTDTNPYYVSIKGSDDSIHIAWMWNRHTSYSDNSFWGVYYMYSTDNGNTWKKRAGTSITLPATESNGDIVFAKETNNLKSVWPLDIQLDGSNNPYILFIEGTRTACDENYGTFNFKFAKYNGSAWVVYTVATGANHLFDRGALRVIDSNNFKVYLTLGGQSNEDGGEIQEYTSTNGGVDWSKTKDITSNSGNIEHNYPITVVDGQTDLQIIWSFGDSNPTKVYGWGEAETFKRSVGIGDVPSGWTESDAACASFRRISGPKGQYDRIDSVGVSCPVYRQITKMEIDNNRCIEFIVKGKALPSQTYHYIRFKETAPSENYGILLTFKDDGNIDYYDGSWHTLQTYSQNVEYRFEIYNIDFTNNQFDIDINGVNKGTNLGFAVGQSFFEHIVLDASGPESWEYMLMDYTFFFTRNYVSPEPTWGTSGGEVPAPVSLAFVGTNAAAANMLM